MAAPASIDELNNPRRQGQRGVKKSTTKSGGAVSGFFDKFRRPLKLDKEIAAITFTDGRIYDFTVEEVITLLPIENEQKDKISQEFTTSTREVQESLIKHIEKRFMQFVEEYVKFRFDQLLIEKVMHGQTLDNVQRAAEEMTLRDFESVLDNGVSYVEMIQPFLRRQEKSGMKQLQDDIRQIEEALLADMGRERKSNGERATKMATKIPFIEAVKAAKLFVFASIVQAFRIGAIDPVQFLVTIDAANDKIIGPEWRYEGESVENFSLYEGDKLAYTGNAPNFEASSYFQDYLYRITYIWQADQLIYEMKDSIVRLTNPQVPSFEARQKGASVPTPYTGDFTDTEVYEIWKKHP